MKNSTRFKVGLKTFAATMWHSFLGGFMLFGATLAFKDAHKCLTPEYIREKIKETEPEEGK